MNKRTVKIRPSTKENASYKNFFKIQKVNPSEVADKLKLKGFEALLVTNSETKPEDSTTEVIFMEYQDCVTISLGLWEVSQVAGYTYQKSIYITTRDDQRQYPYKEAAYTNMRARISNPNLQFVYMPVTFIPVVPQWIATTFAVRWDQPFDAQPVYKTGTLRVDWPHTYIGYTFDKLEVVIEDADFRDDLQIVKDELLRSGDFAFFDFNLRIAPTTAGKFVELYSKVGANPYAVIPFSLRVAATGEILCRHSVYVYNVIQAPSNVSNARLTASADGNNWSVTETSTWYIYSTLGFATNVKGSIMDLQVLDFSTVVPSQGTFELLSVASASLYGYEVQAVTMKSTIKFTASRIGKYDITFSEVISALTGNLDSIVLNLRSISGYAELN